MQASGATARVAPAWPADHAQPLGHDPAALAAAVGPRTRMMFVANPKQSRPAPGSTKGRLDALLRAVPPEVIVVLDEAYHEYSTALGVPDGTRWLHRHPNLVVTRTFSKAYGLAGLRVGYAISHPDVADILNRVRQPFNVSVPALAAAAAALDDHEHLEATIALNRAGSNGCAPASRALGIVAPPSAGNFILADLRRPAGPVDHALLREGVIVRPLANYGLLNHLRISTGTEEQNERVARCHGARASGSRRENRARNYVATPGGRAAGEVRVPGDKSISHRAALLGAIAQGTTEIRGFLEGAGLRVDARRAVGDGRASTSGSGPGISSCTGSACMGFVRRRMRSTSATRARRCVSSLAFWRASHSSRRWSATPR